MATPTPLNLSSTDADSLNVKGGNSTNNINLSTGGNIFFWVGMGFVAISIAFILKKKR